MANEKLGNVCYHHTAILCQDVEKALKFYTEGLGFNYVCEWGEGENRKIMLDLGNGSRLELFAGGDDSLPDKGRLVHIAFEVEDPEKAYAAAIAAGATPSKPPYEPKLNSTPVKIDFVTSFCFGPSGETLEFLKMN